MKINAINLYKANYASNNISMKQINGAYSPHFEGIFDVFKKSDRTEEEIAADKEIKDYVKLSTKNNEATKKSAKVYFKHLKKLLNEGKKSGYRCPISYVDRSGSRKNVNFSDIDETMQAPTWVNIWQDGKFRTAYELYSTEPKLAFHVFEHSEDNEIEYSFLENESLGYFYQDKEGHALEQYPYENGFIEVQSQKVNEDILCITSELFYDYKDPENSYYRENTGSEMIEYCFDKKENMWLKNRIIPLEEYAKMAEEMFQ